MKRYMLCLVVSVVALGLVWPEVGAAGGCAAPDVAPDTVFVSIPSAVVYTPDVQFEFDGSAPGIPVGYYYCFDSDCVCPAGPAWPYTAADNPVVSRTVSLGTHTFAVATNDGFPPGPIAVDPYPAYFTFCYADPLDDQGEAEYNNDKAHATVVGEGKVVRGNNKSNGDDWFTITNDRPGVSEMTVWVNSSSRVSVSVYDWDGLELAAYTVPQGSTEPSYAKFGAYPGVYFIKVAEDRNYGGEYELVAYFSELPCWQLREVDPHYDSSGLMSNYLPWDVAMRGDNKHNEHDYYYFTIGDVQTDVTLELKSYGGRVTAHMLEVPWSGTKIVSVSVNAGEHKCSETKKIAVAGAYFLDVVGDRNYGGTYDVHIHTSVAQVTPVAGLPPYTRITGATLGRAYDTSQEFIWTATDDSGHVEYAFQTDEDPNNWSAWTSDVSVTLSDYSPGAHWIGVKSCDNTLQEDTTPHWSWFLYAAEFDYESEYNNEMRFANPVEQGLEIRGNNKSDGDDWFELINTEPGLGVLAAYVESADRVTMSLYDRNGNQIGTTSVHSNWRYGPCWAAAPPGQYYIKISEDRNYGGEYNFVAGFMTPPSWWTTEITPYNHDAHRPNHLPFDVQVRGNNKYSDDYYCLTLTNVPTELTTWCYNTGKAEIRLYGPDGAEIDRFNPLAGHNQWHLWPRLHQRGTYLVRVLEDRNYGGGYLMKWWTSVDQTGGICGCGRRPETYLTGCPWDIADSNGAEFLWFAEDCRAVEGFTYQFDGEEFSCKTSDNGVRLSGFSAGGHYLAVSAIDNTRRVDKRPSVGAFLYADTERDEAESNNGKAEAETIVPGQWVKGNNRADEDWFTFENTQAGLRHVIVVLESIKKVTVELLDGASFEHASTSCNSDARRQSFVASIKRATYYLTVPRDHNYGGDYRVAFGYVDIPPYYGHEHETNNSCPEANVISMYQYQHVVGNNRGDDDCYKFAVTDDETPVSVQLWLRGYSAKASAILYDPTGYELGRVSVTDSYTDARDFDLAKAGVYCITVPRDHNYGGFYGVYLDPKCEPSWVRLACDNFAYSDWVALGKPACWNSAYQCDGDADCKTQGFQKYRVMSNDLGIVAASWKNKIDDVTLDPCADLDHKAQGFQKYRVFTNDLAVLIANWKKKDCDLAGDCPRPE